MKQELEKCSKLEDIKHNDFTKLPEYMEEKCLDKARLAFRIKSKMVQGIKMNFKGSHKGNLACDKCDLKCDETQHHTLLCDGWKEQREGLDLTQMQDMVIFFTRLLEEKGLRRD